MPHSNSHDALVTGHVIDSCRQSMTLVCGACVEYLKKALTSRRPDSGIPPLICCHEAALGRKQIKVI